MTMKAFSGSLLEQVLGHDRVAELESLAATHEPDEGDLERLILALPTTVYETRVRILTEKIEQSRARGCEPDGQLAKDLALAHYDLSNARLRDTMTASRQALGSNYEACWCLGQGGRHPVRVALLDPDGALVCSTATTYREICPCPDGDAANLVKLEVVNEAEAAAVASWQQRLTGNANIPVDYQGLTVESWEQAQLDCSTDEDRERVARIIAMVKQAAQVWWKNARDGKGPRVLMLVGDYGSGKTGFAYALVQAWLARNRPAICTTCFNLFEDLRASYRQSEGVGRREWTIVQKLSMTPLLLLDDLGAEGINEKNESWIIPTLTAILDARQERGLPTIVTTNLARDQMEYLYGERLCHRLWSSGVAIQAKFGGLADLRNRP